MKMLFPDAKFRSPTAVDGKSDMRDENVYSACVVTNAAAGNTTVFTVARGQTIPKLGAATAAAHQLQFTELTTNISQNGQLGAAIGDSAFRAIGITIEQGYYDRESASLNTYGAGIQQVTELLAKTFFQLRIAGKLQIQGPTMFFPASGAVFGSIGTGQDATVGLVNNGWPGALRRLKLPILVGRTDTIEGVYGVAGGASLVFGTDQPTLIWFNIYAAVAGDAR